MTSALHELVHCMNKQEKRYFRLYATQHIKKGSNDYLRLFDIVSCLNEYDEKLVKQKLGHAKLATRFAFLKHYLYNSILEALTRYHDGHSAESELNGLLRKIETLYVKSLYTQCLRLIQRGIKLAVQYEKFTRHFDLLEWEKMVHVAMRYSHLDQDRLEQIMKEEKLAAQRLLGERESVYYGLGISVIVQSEGFTNNKNSRKRLEQIMARPVLGKRFRHPSFRSELFAHSSRSIYTLVTNQLEKSLKYSYERIALMEKRPLHLKENILAYIQSLNNLIITCEHIGGRQREIEEAINKLEKLKAGRLREHASLRLFLALTARKCGLYILAARFEDTAPLAREIEEGFAKYKNSVSPHDRLVFSYFIAYLFYGNGDHANAGRWLNRIIQHTPSGTREDVQSMARIMYLLLNYDKGNDDYLFYLLQTFPRHLARKKQLFEFEKLVFRFLKLLVTKKPAGAALKEIFRQMKKEVMELKDTHSKKMLSYFDLLSWFDSHITGRSFTKLMKEKTEKQVPSK